MATKKHDWDTLKQEYIYGDYESINAFFESHGIGNGTNTRNKIKDWDKEKKERLKKIIKEVTDEEDKKKFQEILKVNEVSRIGLTKAKELSEGINNMDELKKFTSAMKDLKEIIIEDSLEEDKPIIYIPAKDIPEAFCNLNRWIDNRKYNEIWLEGGRGSAKSSYWSEKIVEMLENNDNYCALLIRKVGNTLKDSVFSQMEWAIDQLEETYPGIKKRWKSAKSPLEMTNVETGQKIYFRGADDPGKIKSIKPPKGKYIALEVYEEFDQMNGMNEVRKIDQSVVRGGDYFLRFRVYNTPKSNRHFVNLEKNIPKEGRLVHKSDYRTVPVEWLGQPFIDDAEYLKSVNEKIYNNEYLGECTGDGGDVFENLDIREITDEEINNFDYIYMGLDFGWYPDILAWTKMCYQPNKKTLYIYDEFTVNKMSNQDVWNYLVENKGVTSQDLIIADSAEPKSIGDFASYGAFIRGAKKGPDSVSYSMKWLSSLAKIVIDPKRCPVATTEFSTYQYETDKDDNFISSYPDKDNHTIDSVRYAMNPIWKRKGE